MASSKCYPVCESLMEFWFYQIAEQLNMKVTRGALSLLFKDHIHIQVMTHGPI